MDVTKDDIRESRNLILEEMRRGFDGIHRRQDITNGRVATVENAVGELEILVARHDERLDITEKPAMPQSPDQRPLTRWDATLVAVASALNAWRNWGDPCYGQEAKACVALAIAAGLFAAFGTVYP